MVLTCRKQWDADLPIIERKLSDNVKTTRENGNVIGTTEVMVFNEETNGIQCLNYVKKGEVKSIKLFFKILRLLLLHWYYIQRKFCSNGKSTDKHLATLSLNLNSMHWVSIWQFHLMVLGFHLNYALTFMYPVIINCTVLFYRPWKYRCRDLNQRNFSGL